MRASGRFEVQVTPQPPYHTEGGVSLARVSIDKQFSGDLDATSHVEMLSATSAVKGSAGYVAIERVVGALHGRTGSFILQHSGSMTRGQPTLALSVVPDTGTGQLTGLSGQMAIEIVDGQHRFSFDYSL